MPNVINLQNKDLCFIFIHTTQLFMVYSDKSTPNMYIISTKDYKIGTTIMFSTWSHATCSFYSLHGIWPMFTGFYGHITKQTAS